jgi:phosphoserine aminotransferase
MSLKRNPSRNVINFAAGPSALPYEVKDFLYTRFTITKLLEQTKVLEKAQRELVDFANTGTSVMGEHFKLFSVNKKRFDKLE